MRPHPIESLESVVAARISTGNGHTLLASVSGDCYTWGVNDDGQLGLGDTTERQRPTKLTELSNKHIIDVASGHGHSLVLTKKGEVYGFGNGLKGQEKRKFPSLIEPLIGKPIAKVACGDFFSLVLSTTGALYSFGSNSHGQLGVGDCNDRLQPTPVRRVSGLALLDIACGAQHALALTDSHLVYSWGDNSAGQLGHSDTEQRTRPELILALENVSTIQISAGRRHSLSLTANGQAYSWGASTAGQLGLGSNQGRTQPALVPAADVSFVKAGSDHSLILQGAAYKAAPRPAIETLQLDVVKRLMDSDTTGQFTALQRLISQAFSSPSALNSAFRPSLAPVTDRDPGFKYEDIDNFYHLILTSGSAPLIKILADSTVALVQQFPHTLFDQSETLSLFPILLQSPLLDRPVRDVVRIVQPLLTALDSLVPLQKVVLEQWWSEPKRFRRLVHLFQSFLSFFFLYESSPAGLVASVHMLTTLYEINSKQKFLSDSDFYNADVSRKLPLEEDFKIWQEGGQMFSFLGSARWLLDPRSKSRLISELSQRYTIMELSRVREYPYLQLVVRREFVFEDTWDQWDQTMERDVRFKVLKVAFEGEEGIDEGGLSNEYMQLLVQDMCNPKHGIFEMLETRFAWFNTQNKTPEQLNRVRFAGTILGLALRTGVLVSPPFPALLYRKLAGEELGLDDLGKIKPSVCNSLTKLLEYEGDVEKMGLWFVASNGPEEIPLLPNGGDVPVTTENREEYVRRYVQWELFGSVEAQFNAFKEGLNNVIPPVLLSLLKGNELELALSGDKQQGLDLVPLQRSTAYEGFEPGSEVVTWFWNAVHKMDEPSKRHFLAFATGSDRIPLAGLQTLKLVIQRAGPDSDRLPTAHTCFNTILLPQYKSEKKLQKKLGVAIANYQGFGLK